MFDMTFVSEWLREILLPGLGTLVATAAFTLLRKYIQRLNDERLRQLLLDLVQSAEQIYGPGRGDDKRRYVMDQLKQKGMSDVQRHALEATVYQMQSEG